MSLTRKAVEREDRVITTKAEVRVMCFEGGGRKVPKVREYRCPLEAEKSRKWSPLRASRRTSPEDILSLAQ